MPVPGDPAAATSKAAPEGGSRAAQEPRSEQPRREDPKPEDRLQGVVVDGERLRKEIDEKNLSGYVRVVIELLRKYGEQPGAAADGDPSLAHWIASLNAILARRRGDAISSA